MAADASDYLDGLPEDVARRLEQANQAGLSALRKYLTNGEAVAFLGAGASAPLYPLWSVVISQMIDAAEARGLPADAANTCRQVAASQPDAVVEIVSLQLGHGQYQAVLREVFRVRRDPDSGRTWTPVQELVCRCAFKAVVTTNYDPGVVDARMRVRPRAVGTGFASWTDEVALDRWRTGDVFAGEDELPVLFAHGHHNQPEAMVLATTDYRRAYAGKLTDVIARMVDAWHLVWLGFSFADQRIAAVLRQVAERGGMRTQPGAAPRHVAVMAFNPDDGTDPATLSTLGRIQYGADLVLYPAPNGDHSALRRLLATFTDPRYPPAPVLIGDAPVQTPASAPVVPSSGTTRDPAVRDVAERGTLARLWVHGIEPTRVFVGRVEDLAKLDRWATDRNVRLIGISAWGGAGKTALVTHWLEQSGGAESRPGVRGVFVWSFYTEPDPSIWASTLLDWAAETLHLNLGPDPNTGQSGVAARLVRLLGSAPLVLVLDGLEVLQEGPAGDGYGRLLDGLMRHVLTAACRSDHPSLVVLTSRFPFADLARFDGTTARMLEVPAFTPAEGATLLAAAGAAELSEQQRRELVAEVDGHALAVSTMGALLAEHPGQVTATELLRHLFDAGPTGRRLGRVLDFYAERLSPAHRHLVAAVSLFSRPVIVDEVLAVARHAVFDGHLRTWSATRVQAAIGGPLAGLLSWHADGRISAHPLVREAFRPIALGAAHVAVQVSLTDTPQGTIASSEQALRVVEAVELLLDAGQWTSANDLYQGRSDDGLVWMSLPAARLGQRAAAAFVATPARRQDCATHLGPRRLGYYLSASGLFAMLAGDMYTAEEYLEAGVRHDREPFGAVDLSIGLQNLAQCVGHRGRAQAAFEAAQEALEHATAARDRMQIKNASATWGWAADLAGETSTAEKHFLDADSIEHADHPERHHLHSVRGVWWGWFLARTGRPGPARRLAEANLTISQHEGWHQDVALIKVLLARLGLAAGDPAAADEPLLEALACLRDGDYVVDLADALTVAAEHARQTGDLDGAERYADEALSIAIPWELTLSHISALAVRARVAADRFTATGDLAHLHRGRDAAESADRLGSGAHPLPWWQLDAWDAHALLDRAEHADHGWTKTATSLRQRLVPAGLDPDPLATMEHSRPRRGLWYRLFADIDIDVNDTRHRDGR